MKKNAHFEGNCNDHPSIAKYRARGRSCLTAFLDNKEVKQERPLILTLEL